MAQPTECSSAYSCDSPLEPSGFPDIDTCQLCQCFIEIQYDTSTDEWSVAQISDLKDEWECLTNEDGEDTDVWIYDGKLFGVCTWHMWSSECEAPWEDEILLHYIWEAPDRDLDTRTEFGATDMAVDVGYACQCQGGACNSYVDYVTGDETGIGGTETVRIKAQQWFDDHPGQTSFSFTAGACWFVGSLTVEGFYILKLESPGATFERQYYTSAENSACCEEATTTITIHKNGTITFADSQSSDSTDLTCEEKTCPELGYTYPSEYPSLDGCVVAQNLEGYLCESVFEYREVNQPNP
jgi:hypothetical protein